jgi:transcription-repair coupling factor (superfamily II helicase)
MSITILETKHRDIFSAINNINTLLTQGKKVYICTQSKFSLVPIQKILTEHNCNAQVVSALSNTKSGVANVCQYITKKSFVYQNNYFFTEENIFGKVVVSAKKKREISTKKQMIIANGYSVGDLVVHKTHGVSRFEGLFMVQNQGKAYDTAKLTYKGGDILYIPVVNINILTKYGSIPEGVEVESLLDKLHTNGFVSKKEKVKKNLLEIAEKLVKEAAKRKEVEAVIFHENDLTKKFDDQFLFTPTEDQALAIEDCKNDLSSGMPMERLICGDVGFGKTEVAMRACALVVLNDGSPVLRKSRPDEVGQKETVSSRGLGQVCVICPTTLLAQQHFKTFSNRFNSFNVKIAKITRTTSAKERKHIIEQINIGEIDILIATHAGFNDEIAFKNLELLVIDEEQHFGVEQKEKIKSKFLCHVLLLSATPIPRTLQMGLSGLRDISIIATPPFDRLLPQTQVMTFDSIVISNAILREKAQNGRTFFVCPRVSDLEEQKARILAITGGEVSVGVAHGGMPPRDLEVIMDKFYSGVYDVLVTTSIVESGIDISFANTMILYRAEMFGLSALYQLRGRVGRGKMQSYVYFVVKDINRMTDNAKQRLKAISSISSLGEGMKIAVSDLDIRGAGNIVGKEQHGKINDVGVELYEQMLKEAVTDIKNDTKHDNEDYTPEIKLSIPFFIPEEYIPDFSLRIQIYRELSTVEDIESLGIIQEDIVDRFGTIPQEILNLIEVIKIKIKAKTLCISKLEGGTKGIVLHFANDFQKNDEVISALKKHPNKFQIKTANSILCVSDGEDLLKKTNAVLKWVEGL